MAAGARRPRWVAACEALGLLAFGLLWSALAARGAPVLAEAPLWAVLGALLGVLAADLASGVVHWLCDSFGSPETPVLGPLVVAPFREHHARPEEIARHGPVQLLGTTALALAPVLAAALLVAPSWRGGWGAWALGGALGFTALAAATNAIHLFAHRSAPPALAWLQRRGLLLSPEAHARHHAPPYGVAYCITTGWCNPLLDRTRVLPRLARRAGRRAPPAAGRSRPA